MTPVRSAPDALRLIKAGPDRYSGWSVAGDRPVFGGQLLGQLIVAGAQAVPDKQVRSVHAAFVRAGASDRPLDFAVTAVHRGRALATSDIAVRIADQEICRAVVMSDAPDTAVLTWSEGAPDLAGPESGAPAEMLDTPGAQVRLVGDGVLDQLSPNGPPELALWVRWSVATGAGRATHQGLASWYCDPILIPASLRPVDGVSVSMAHGALSTAVLNHTLVFHAEPDVSQWLLYTVRTVQAGLGRIYGEGRVFTETGDLVASFSQWSMVRPMPPGRTDRPGPVM